MTVERIHPKAPVMLIFIAIFTCLPSCINLSNITPDLCQNLNLFSLVMLMLEIIIRLELSGFYCKSVQRETKF